jgi:hypothetical protein
MLKQWIMLLQNQWASQPLRCFQTLVLQRLRVTCRCVQTALPTLQRTARAHGSGSSRCLGSGSWNRPHLPRHKRRSTSNVNAHLANRLASQYVIQSNSYPTSVTHSAKKSTIVSIHFVRSKIFVQKCQHNDGTQKERKLKCIKLSLARSISSFQRTKSVILSPMNEV